VSDIAADQTRCACLFDCVRFIDSKIRFAQSFDDRAKQAKNRSAKFTLF
jgi:hypothetical protein